MLQSLVESTKNQAPTEALRAALRAIPDGQMTATSNRAGISLTQLLRLRRGERLDVRISTLARLARAMGKSADELLGLEKPDPVRAIAERDRLSDEAAARVRRKVEKIVADSTALIASLQPAASKPAKRQP